MKIRYLSYDSPSKLFLHHACFHKVNLLYRDHIIYWCILYSQPLYIWIIKLLFIWQTLHGNIYCIYIYTFRTLHPQIFTTCHIIQETLFILQLAFTSVIVLKYCEVQLTLVRRFNLILYDHDKLIFRLIKLKCQIVGDNLLCPTEFFNLDISHTNVIQWKTTQ